MIKIQKGDEPQVITDNIAEWEGILRGHEAAGTNPSDTQLNRYRHDDIKAALLAETHRKCAYCESRFGHVYYGDIEHVTPKKLGIEHRFRWENLTIACRICNTNKGIKENLVDPYIHDPEDLFYIQGPTILPLPDSSIARFTEMTIDLNRSELLERRNEKLRKLHDLLTLANEASDPDLKEALYEQLKSRETADEMEYAAIARAYVSSLVAQGLIPAASAPAA
ncbi:HNH endonuclease [Rhizobium sp. 2MFCol3.1]|uniref:HNH endonuclease n=1 Tax=Rhizobium sp. 2MFCol3.1 TaxID=1246459 RepID=UPI0003765E12|nr:HNH endonuclease [Rhizobium sp. 2MFCol3.1]